MRPLNLTMQAFGPYRERETLDFTELGPNRVFLIHGDTGAGKTTILDAMVFALYGDTSGGERQAAQMRCESAPDTLPTEVTFDFLLGARSFRVKRRPAQQLTGARGRSVIKQADVTLWDRTGCSEGEEGTVLAVKITDANNLIKDTLGFSCDQFRQVVVLPQGRFRELLSAGSDKREDILRQLFRTARFRQLEEALAERAKAVRTQMQELNAQRTARLSLVDARDDAELSALMDAAVSDLRAATEAASHADAAALAAEARLSASEAAHEALSALALARAELEALQARAEEFMALRARVETAVRADRVRPTADRLVDAGLRSRRAEVALEEAGAALAAAREAELSAGDAMATEDSRAGEREAAATEVRRLEGLTGAIEAWRRAAADLAGCEERAASAALAVQTTTQARSVAEERVTSLQQLVAAARTAAARMEAAEARLLKARQDEGRCRRLLEAHAAVEAAEERHAQQETAERDALDALNRAEAQLSGLEERWRAGRAAALAETLAAGEPCPVCGATVHPAPAQAGEAHVSDAALAEARAAMEDARRTRLETLQALATAKNDLTEATVRERGILAEPGARTGLGLADAVAEVAVCTAELDELTTRAELGEAVAALAAAEEEAEAARGTAAAAGDELTAAEKSMAAAEARLGERAAAAPEEVRAEGALEDATERAGLARKVLDDSFAEARQRLSAAKEVRIAREAAAEGAGVAAAEAAAHEQVCLAEFAAAVQGQGFAGEHEWRAALLSEQERGALAAAVEGYGTEVDQAMGRLYQAELAVAGRPEPGDLAALRSAAEAARSTHATAISHSAHSRNVVDNLTKLRQALDEIDTRSADVQRVYQTVGVLAEVANGGNAGRVSFQRWVLGVYLDEVLVSASRKLFIMSKGRYRLQRQKEVGSRRRASGLELDVFDEFSGSARPAVTLSGGESFLAALALALGLAETVQEHAAGVPLETIFVDEGFGALDSDALELVIDALMELQLGGRLVGVISHVPELRQVIPARLEVRGGSSGSSARFVVP